MPSRLKFLELQGYKTFASKVEFAFSESVTAIVGPNGSGKSNVADSIRWVLGEQSYSLLRGKKTEDMIYTGSELRPRAGMASATITFDNSDNWLPIDFGEVAVTRRAYRDGQNEYLINGQRVRLKDVSELLANSGLAERTYTVIGQGLVDTALAIRPEERRRLFEEAAGIGLHRSRKEEALRRLESTRRNLERVEDILSELQPRLKSLERQARRVQEYEQIKADLKILLRDWYGYHWHRAQVDVSEAKELVRIQELSVDKARQDQTEVNNQLGLIRDQVREVRNLLNSNHLELSQLHRKFEENNKSIAVLEERERSQIEAQINSSKEIIRFDEEISYLKDRLDASINELDSFKTDFTEASSRRKSAVDELMTQQMKRSVIEQEARKVQQELSTLTNQQFQLKTGLANRIAQIGGLEKSIQSIENGLLKNRNERTQILDQLSLTEQALKEQRQKLRKAEEEVQSHRKKQNESVALKQKTIETRGEIQTHLAQLEAQNKVLQQAENTYVGYTQGTKELLCASQKSPQNEIRGALSQFLELPVEIEIAIAAVLGDYTDAVLIENQPDHALDILMATNQRGCILPLELIQTSNARIGLPEMDGVIGIASELCKTAQEFIPVMDLLLGNVVIVEDRNTAKKMYNKLRNHHSNDQIRIVTLQGEVFHLDGPIRSIGKGRENKSVLGRPRQIRELEMGIASDQKSLGEIKEKIINLELDAKKMSQLSDELFQVVRSVNRSIDNHVQTQNKANQNLEVISRQISWQDEQLKKNQEEMNLALSDQEKTNENLRLVDENIEKTKSRNKQIVAQLTEVTLDEFQENVSRWTTNLAVAERAIESAKKRSEDLRTTYETRIRQKTTLEERIQEFTRSLGTVEHEKQHYKDIEKQIHNQIEIVQGIIDPYELQIAELEKQLEKLEKKEQVARQSLAVVESQAVQVRNGFVRRQEALDSLRRRIEDDFGLVNFEYTEDVSGPTPLPFDGMVEQLPNINQLSSEIEEAIKRQRAQIRRIGPVNPEVLTEFKEVQSRFLFLTEQIADLQAADLDIRKVIQELDVLMQKEFRNTFNQVALVFKEYFTRLFGGGSARLILTNPEDLTESGVEIEARLPGRRTQGLSLLSGGERSLTAVALVFALLKVSPTPFCLLDEVDAMLDEANVHRFRELLKELSLNTQFVIVTHNRNTVQVADYIYGVTLGRDLASQVLSLKLDEVARLVGEEG